MLADAEEILIRAVNADPRLAEAHSNLGTVQRKLGKSDLAWEHFQVAIAIRPNLFEALAQIGALYAEQLRFEQAIEYYDKAIAVNPDCSEAHVGKALLWLLQGDYLRGFAENEWRFKSKLANNARFIPDVPRWTSEPLQGKRIIIHAEQGQGDILHFVRYAPLVAQQAARTYVVCYPPLKRLLMSIKNVQILVPGDPLLEVDYQAAMMSLPWIFGTTLQNIPDSVPYLWAAAEDVQKWKQKLTGTRGLKVGLVWAGNPEYPDDQSRSMPLKAMEPLGEIPGIQFYSLQKGKPVAQLQSTPMNILDWMEELNDFADTAAFVMNLDLVISVDTAVAHLAGAGQGGLDPLAVCPRFSLDAESLGQSVVPDHAAVSAAIPRRLARAHPADCRAAQGRYLIRGRFKLTRSSTLGFFKSKNPMAAPPRCAPSPPALWPLVKIVKIATPSRIHANARMRIGNTPHTFTMVSGAIIAAAISTPKIPADAPTIAESAPCSTPAAQSKMYITGPAIPQSR